MSPSIIRKASYTHIRKLLMPRSAGPWAKNKLKLLELYLPGYLQATTKTLDRIYIDAFAGPGRNQIRGSDEIVDGSPLIALDAVAMDSGSRFTELYFIEQEEEVAQELREAIASRGDQRARVIVGDTNIELPRLVRSLNRRAPTFVFLDTESIDPAWATIEAIAPWRTELLINFPLGMAINRNPDSGKVDAYFGTNAWREHWERRDVRGLLDFYKDNLHKLGYVHQISDDRLVKSGSGSHLYYLIPVSKVAAAATIWQWVFSQPDASGQSRFADL